VKGVFTTVLLKCESIPVEKDPSEHWINILFKVWYVLFIPWLPLAFVAGMASDGGFTIPVKVFLTSFYTYPITVLVAAAFYHKTRYLVLLPCLNLLGFFISGFK